ncbi:ATP-binding protein [Pseudodesulfovibrio sp.]|uniref:ATP-binding protein n=1 Tax=unclassified Pseudodesulfovibrio TaxID=2661612 RepID=UPI003B00F395
MADVITFQMSNKMNCFHHFQPRVEAFGEQHGLPVKVVFHLNLVLDELITNIISYGYTDFDEHPIDVSVALDGDLITIRLEDDAQPFNILEAPEPNFEVPVEDRLRPGGMGVHLVKNMVSRIDYKREDGKNVLILTKDLSKPCCPVNG